MSSWLSDPSANYFIKTYVDGYIDCSGYFINRVGNVMIGNIDYPGYNINQRSLLVNGKTEMNGNLIISGNLSVNSRTLSLGLDASGNNLINISSISGTVSGANSISIGSKASYGLKYNSTAIGYNSTCTDNNQIVLGNANHNVNIPGSIQLQNTGSIRGIKSGYVPSGTSSGTINYGVTFASAPQVFGTPISVSTTIVLSILIYNVTTTQFSYNLVYQTITTGAGGSATSTPFNWIAIC